MWSLYWIILILRTYKGSVIHFNHQPTISSSKIFMLKFLSFPYQISLSPYQLIKYDLYDLSYFPYGVICSLWNIFIWWTHQPTEIVFLATNSCGMTCGRGALVYPPRISTSAGLGCSGDTGAPIAGDASRAEWQHSSHLRSSGELFFVAKHHFETRPNPWIFSRQKHIYLFLDQSVQSHIHDIYIYIYIHIYIYNYVDNHRHI